MSDVNLQNFQIEFPAFVLPIAGVDWKWRDTDPNSDRIPLVFLPGAGGTGDVFYKTVYDLKDARRLITVRYPALYDVRSIISGVVHLFAEIGLQKLDIAGSSLGGYIAQAVALHKPTLVRRMLLGNTFFDASWLQSKISRDELLLIAPAAHLARTVAQLMTLPEENVEQRDFKATMLKLVGPEQTADMAHAYLAAVLGSEPLERLDLSVEAIAILDAEDDAVVDAETRLAVRSRYQGSKCYTLPTGGHYPTLLNPSAYNAAMRDFFGTE